ncbi:hypothetical protein HCUR_00650 [Holospora curviuscula]|uniref:Uncharacterized protein n=1 Tax=Holospora curviuscula TaxID=1082868 RepID=A0A2S5R9J8_9PROT|nr:hypothetical protein HCUR_00650 [Holospora curviuscula]
MALSPKRVRGRGQVFINPLNAGHRKGVKEDVQHPLGRCGHGMGNGLIPPLCLNISTGLVEKGLNPSIRAPL